MSGRFVRASHYRHVFGQPAKPEGEYQEIRANCTGEGNFIGCNDKFFCYSTTGGGGPVVIHPLNKPGRLAHNAPTLAVHKDSVLDFDFNPFVSNVIATGGEDTTVKVSAIPEDGLKATQQEYLASLEGHERKVNFIHWHPTASNVLATASADTTVRVWDAETAEEVCRTDFPEVVQSFDWNPDGSLIVTTCRDLHVRVYDPRVPDGTVLKTAGFTGPKSQRALWQGDKGRIIGLGSSKTSARQYSLWDLKKFDTPLVLQDIDTSAGQLMPFYDPDNSILYVAGKGDGNVRYFEITDEAPYVHFLSEFRDSKPQKGMAWLPKRTCDTTKTEVAVAMRLLSDRVVPISFQVPRKSDQFQKDLYPDAYAGVPAMNANDWLSGRNASAPKQSMNPGAGARGAASTSGPRAASPAVRTASPAVAMPTKKTYEQLERELAEANHRIAELEAQLGR